ncbi:hypothetical protein L1049_015195 [Liquidambar formosana]|uniref:Uncharacterized protein n=1 Tax=Liquidambar formosana TaxID=63359 RepID=A0AAP0S4G4_LIQFO
MSLACSNMFNNEQQGLYTSSMGPRISFSNDFADTHQAFKHESNYKEAPVSSDFEFSVPNDALNTADEIFFKGVLMPFKDNCSTKSRKTTLRDELLVDDECEDVLPRLHKGSGWWKERLGLKRANIGTKRGGLERVVEEERPVMVHEVKHCSQENTGTVE